MRPRPFAVAPLVVAGVALAISSAFDATARDSEGTAATRAMIVAPRPANRRRHVREPSDSHGPRVRAFCTADNCSVTEGHLALPAVGIVCPPGTVSVDDRFCVDRWEATLVEVLADGQETAWPPFNGVQAGHALRAVSVPNVYPQAYISGAQAERACEASGKRLCAPVEWRKACMGPRTQTFGYGSERIEGRCNDRGRSPMLRLFPLGPSSGSPGGTSNHFGLTDMNDPRLNQMPDTLSVTGAHEGCTNEYGVFDMVGNLHEWTNDPHGTFQGGYYLDTHLNGDGCAYRTVAHDMTYHDYSTGFRCCADPKVSE